MRRNFSRRMFYLVTVGIVAMLSFNAGVYESADFFGKPRSQTIIGNPSVVTCPTSNCPAPPFPPIISTQFIHGETTKGASQPEWLSSINLFVKTGSPDGQKVAQYLGVMQQEGAGTAWALNTDIVRNAGLGGPNAFAGFEGSGKAGKPGAIGDRNGTIGYELDFTNWDADSRPGEGAFTVGQYVHAQGSYTSLAGIYFDAKMAASTERFGWSDGIFFNGPALISDNTIVDGSNAKNSLSILGQHKTAVNTTLANNDIIALDMKRYQRVCYNVFNNCIFWDGKYLQYTNNKGVVVFSIDEDGNVFFKGRVTSGSN